MNLHSLDIKPAPITLLPATLPAEPEPPKEIDLKERAKKHTDSALKVLVDIMEDDFAPKQARIQAASTVLDRGWGKPKQEVEQTQILNYQNLLTSIRMNENKFIEVTDVTALPAPQAVPRPLTLEELMK